jgi:hypothetical protein
MTVICGTGFFVRCRRERTIERKDVTLRAQCHSCSVPFELRDLYAADPRDADRCPNCAAHLGVAGLGHTTFRIERHLRAFSEALRVLADEPGAFTVDTTGLRKQALEVLDQLDEPPPLNVTTRIASGARR